MRPPSVPTGRAWGVGNSPCKHVGRQPLVCCKIPGAATPLTAVRANTHSVPWMHAPCMDGTSLDCRTTAVSNLVSNTLSRGGAHPQAARRGAYVGFPIPEPVAP